MSHFGLGMNKINWLWVPTDPEPKMTALERANNKLLLTSRFKGLIIYFKFA
jgi:hypothetical protein